MRFAIASWLTFASAILVIACGPGTDDGLVATAGPDDARARHKPVVFAVNYPLTLFAQRIAEDEIDVRFPAPADTDPAHWSPDPETVAAFQTADLVLLNGAGYAPWISRASLRRDRLIDTSSAFHDRRIPIRETTTHQHGPQGKHLHAGFAITTWLDPQIAILHAQAIGGALTSLLPEHAKPFRARLSRLERDLQILDTRMRHIADRLGDRPLLFSHPVYQYLIARYELNGRELHWEPDSAPDEEMWQELEASRQTFPATLMIWEAAPLDETAKRLEHLGIESVVFAPLGKRPVQGDYFSEMSANIERLQIALGPDDQVATPAE